MTTAEVTVFGGTGFLGARIVRRLSDCGLHVRVATRRVELVSGGVPWDVVTPLRADVTDPSTVEPALSGATTVINAVGLYSEQGTETFDAVHVHGADTVARCAAEAGVTCLIHLSGIGAREDSPSRYVRARALGERKVRQRFPAATIFRPSVLFGPGDAFLGTLDGLTRMLPVIPLFGGGETQLQPVYVDDVAEAVAGAMQGSQVQGRICELGGPCVHSYREIIEMVMRFRGRRRLLLPVPFAVWTALAKLLSPLPRPPISEDQVILMRDHNVVGPEALTMADLGVAPRPLAELLPACLATTA